MRPPQKTMTGIMYGILKQPLMHAVTLSKVEYRMHADGGSCLRQRCHVAMGWSERGRDVQEVGEGGTDGVGEGEELYLYRRLLASVFRAYTGTPQQEIFKSET